MNVINILLPYNGCLINLHNIKIYNPPSGEPLSSHVSNIWHQLVSEDEKNNYDAYQIMIAVLWLFTNFLSEVLARSLGDKPLDKFQMKNV